MRYRFDWPYSFKLKFIYRLTATCTLVLLFGAQAFASVPPLRLSVVPSLIAGPVSGQASVAEGGRRELSLSLLSVRRKPLNKTQERIFIGYGAAAGAALTDEAGRFHAELEKEGKRVVIDLQDVVHNAIGADELKRVMRGSSLVTKAEIKIDPFGRSTNVIFECRKPVQLVIESVPGEKRTISIELSAAERVNGVR